MKTVIEMAREAGLTVCRDEWVFRAMLERFAELVRADERAKLAKQQAQQEPATVDVVINNMGKPFAVKAYASPQPAPVQQEPVAWKHDCAALLTNDVELWIDRCPHCGKPRTPPPAQQRKPLTDEQQIKVRRELFSFHSEQDWINKGRSRYAKCGVPKGYYITIDAAGHVMHMGKCFKNAAYPVTCYELQTNWAIEAAHGITKGNT